VNPDAFESVELEQIPEGARKVGTMLIAQDNAGNKRPVRVHEVNETTIVLDLNQPLAGKNLNFEVKILAVE
jgi:FKBP-type peptidyl-prolyl cis-trans isomerase 2